MYASSSHKLLRRALGSSALILATIFCQTYAMGAGFLTAPTYPAGFSPLAVASADFNGDGHPDVAVPNAPDDTVDILLNNGDGTFKTAVPYTVGSNPTAIFAGDLNGDSKVDLVVLDEFGSGGGTDTVISVLLGNGDGTFQPMVTYQSGGSDGQHMDIGDFNGDSKLDIIVENMFGPGGIGGPNISVLLGNGNGSFQAPVTTTLPQFTGVPDGVVAGDFNHDGKLDAVVVGAVFLGNGNGTFQPFKLLDIGNAIDFRAADLNGDGRLDLITVNYTDVGVALGNGDGTFQTLVTYPGGGQAYGVTISDVNGDGKADVIVGGLQVNSILLGNGDGTLQSPLRYARDSGGPSPNSTRVAIDDFDGDGHVDLAMADQVTQSVGVFLGNGDGTFHAPLSATATLGAMAKGDFNADGKLDFASPSVLANQVQVFLGNGDGTFQAPLSFATGKAPIAVVAADFNGDSKLDLAVGNINGANVSILLGKGDGTFLPAKNYKVFTNVVTLAAGDFNGDGKPDLAVSTTSNRGAFLAVLINKGDGTFNPEVDYSVGQRLSGVAVGDFNKDGKNDVAVFSLGSGIDVLLGNGDGTFQSPATYPTSGSSLRVADVNNDGNLDLVTAFGGLNVLLGNGNGTFQTPISTAGLGTDLTIADLNGDGKLDAATAGGSFYVYLGNGDGTFQPTNYHLDAANIVSGNFNADAATDVLLNVAGITFLPNTGGTNESLTSSQNPSQFNQPVTFTATITASVPGSAGTPTGTVTFKADARTLGTMTLNNGQASVTTSRLPVGSHTIKAIYSGDSNFNRNQTSLTQQVQ